jgi:hypothetical protein
LKLAAQIALVYAVLAGSANAFAQEPSLEAPPPVADPHTLFRKYVLSTLGPAGAIHAALSGSLDQWLDAPPEWGDGATGYAKRWASEFAGSAIGDTTKYAVARLFHHDPSFVRCECSGFGPRLRHAVSSPFMARRRNGRQGLSPATGAGLLAAEVVPASVWYPGPHSTREGLKRVAVDLVGKIGVDVLREFVHRPRHE